MFYRDVKSAREPLEMQAWLTKQSKQALRIHCIGCTFVLWICARYTLLLSLLTRWPWVRSHAVYVCKDFSTWTFSILNMCDIHVGLFTNEYKNGNLEQMCGICLGNFDIYSNLPNCHQCGLICSADDVARKPTWSSVHIFQNWKNCVFECIIVIIGRYTRYRWYIHLHKNLQNWSRTVRSCLLGGVTPSGNLKLIQFQTITLPLLAASPPHKLLLDQEWHNSSSSQP